MKKITRKAELFLGILVVCLGTQSAVAYFSDVEEAANRVTIGKVDISIEEPKWDALEKDEKENITPGKQMEKDPQIKNIGLNDAFVFMTADVPVANVITANGDGTRNNKSETELFTWETLDGWQQIGSMENVKNEKDVTIAHRYLYVYGTKENCTALAKEHSTPALFQNVKYANVIEGERLPDSIPMEESVLDIQIKGYAIQTTDLTKDSVTSPEKVWKVFTNQNPGIFSARQANTILG